MTDHYQHELRRPRGHTPEGVRTLTPREPRYYVRKLNLSVGWAVWDRDIGTIMQRFQKDERAAADDFAVELNLANGKFRHG